MPISVRTFQGAEEAERALAASRSARYLGGGTLVMRAVNAGDQAFDTIVRAADPAKTIRAYARMVHAGGSPEEALALLG